MTLRLSKLKPQKDRVYQTLKSINQLFRLFFLNGALFWFLTIVSRSCASVLGKGMSLLTLDADM